MIADCKAGKIDMIITKSISRFARNTVTLLETVRMLKSINVDVYFEEQNIHSMSGDGELMLTILASFAQEESLSVSENCKWRIRHNYEVGVPNGFTIYGYDIKKRKMTVNEEQADVVKSIFELSE
jgi:DNA invertase Pin-like site-specific DNA recombinase